MITGYIDHDEATIRSFVRDPEYAEYYLCSVQEDGDAEEIAYTEAVYQEARRRREREISHWRANAAQTVKAAMA